MLINARKCVNYDLKQIWQFNDVEKLNVEFEDGVVEASGRTVIYSWFFWQYHREFDYIPIIKEHLIAQKSYTSHSHSEFLEKVMWSVYDLSLKIKPIDVETLKDIAYEITCDVFNKLTYNLEEYVTSSCILDYLEIIEDEEITELIENAEPNQISLKETKEKLKNRLQNSDTFQDNGLKDICEEDRANWDQLLQNIGFRGYATDTDNYFFPYPIMNGYVHGITKLRDSLMESTSSIKSLLAQDDALKNTEFFNKRIQLLTPIVSGLVDKDCKSTEYVRIRVTENTEKSKGNFKSLIGKFYLDEEDLKLKAIKFSDKHLIGKRIKIRSVMNCRFRHTNRVCKTCYGELSFNVPKGCNLGYFSAVAFCEIISQSVLSLKHVDSAATIDTIYIEPALKQIFDVKGNEIKLKKAYKGGSKILTITIPPNHGNDKPQINFMEDLELVDVITNQIVMAKSNIREFRVTIEDTNDGNFIVAPITLTLGNSNEGAYLSKEILTYIKENNWDITDKGEYEIEIDLEKFNIEDAILTLPKKHMNMLEFKNTISKFMESSGTSKHRLGERLTEYNKIDNKVEQALNRFLELVTEKLTVNIAHLELFILTFMGRDTSKADARLPKYGQEFEFISSSNAFNMRSMGTVMPFKDQFPWMTKVDSYNDNVKHGSVYDGMIAPEFFNK